MRGEKYKVLGLEQSLELLYHVMGNRGKSGRLFLSSKHFHGALYKMGEFHPKYVYLAGIHPWSSTVMPSLSWVSNSPCRGGDLATAAVFEGHAHTLGLTQATMLPFTSGGAKMLTQLCDPLLCQNEQNE